MRLWPSKLRAAAFAVYFYAATTILALAGVPVRLFAPHAALTLARVWVRVVLAGLRPICGISIEVTGAQHLPASGSVLVASQHQSEFDTLIWMMLLARPSYVMKQELLRIPLFGPLLIPAGMIPVDRGAGAAAMRDLLKATALAVQDGRQIVIFPEGTRVPAGERIVLQPGITALSARLRLPVLPVATDSGRRWPRNLLAKEAGPIHIAIGAPIPPGTPRADMLTKIEAHWREMERNGFMPVDNSVGDASPETLK
jgi:1-acyl-sn-glycerol-3-phosphate acyltransferase